MAPKTILFAGFFLLCTFGALIWPQLGVYGYIADYCIGSSSQWWALPLTKIGVRFSFTIAIFTMLGMLIQWPKLRFGGTILNSQEYLLLLFLAIIWFSVLISEATTGRYTVTDHPSIKMTKIFIFLLMMTHIVTDYKKLDHLFWVFVVIALLVGLDAYDTPRRAYVGGRLEGVGGKDFSEANYLGTFMAIMLPIIAVQFLRSGLKGKLLCLISGAFTANTIVLCRSRGAFLGVAAGMCMALMFSPSKHRKKILVAMIIGIIGGISLMDQQFIDRLTTITRSEENRDESAQSRIRLWAAGLQMAADKPMGLGAGNWYNNIVRYIPEYAGKDSHSTYIKCLAELGWHGIGLFLIIVANAYRSLYRVRVLSKYHPGLEGTGLMSYGLSISICILLTCCATMTLIYAEFLWLFFGLAICLDRTVNNTIQEIRSG